MCSALAKFLPCSNNAVGGRINHSLSRTLEKANPNGEDHQRRGTRMLYCDESSERSLPDDADRKGETQPRPIGLAVRRHLKDGVPDESTKNQSLLDMGKWNLSETASPTIEM